MARVRCTADFGCKPTVQITGAQSKNVAAITFMGRDMRGLVA